jgi:hypothetical protein
MYYLGQVSDWKADMAEKTKFEKWQDGINKAGSDAKWDLCDCEIQTSVKGYNEHLVSTPGYAPLNWRYIKAMIWVETGAASKKWTSNPIQIGNPGDPGLQALLTGNEGGELIIPPAWKSLMTEATATSDPLHNIRAGIGYLLMRTATYAIKSIPDPNATIYEIKVQKGDSLSKIAKDNGSTIEVMQKLNPDAQVLVPGQTLKYQKAALKKVIVGWKSMSTSSIAKSYNVGDPMYARKLDYALELIRKGRATVCVQ